MRATRPTSGEGPRVGVCVVTARTDLSTRLVITVTVRRDVEDDDSESILHTSTTSVALAQVAEFLAAVHDDVP